MMTTSREGSTGKGAHEYECGPFTITMMGNDLWQIFERTPDGKLVDIGEDCFKTLGAARKWCKAEIVARIDATLAKDGRPALRGYTTDTLRMWLKAKIGTTCPKAKTRDDVTQKVCFTYEACRMVEARSE
jgi:hypothetical protein